MPKYPSLEHRLASLQGETSTSPGARFATATVLFGLVAVVGWVFFPSALRPSGLFAGWCALGVVYYAEHKGFRWRSGSAVQRTLVLATMLAAIVLGGGLAMAVGGLI